MTINYFLSRVLQPLTLSAATFTVGSTQGTVIGNILGTTPNSIITLGPVSIAGSLQVVGTSLQVGPTPIGAPSTITFDLIETLANIVDSPNLTYFSVSAISGTIPVNTAVPTVAGVAQVGQPLTVNFNGSWTNVPTFFTYQWFNSITGPILGAIGISYTSQSSDFGATITVHVFAHNGSGVSVFASSVPTLAVIAASTSIPVNTALPTILGTAQVGTLLTANFPGSWTNTPILNFTYQWMDAAPTPDVLNFNATSGSTITVSGRTFTTQNANQSWSLSKPDNQTLVFDIRNGDVWSGDVGKNRSEISKTSLFTPGTEIIVRYNFEMLSSTVNSLTATGLTIGQMPNDDITFGGTTSPPFEIDLWPNDNMSIYIGNLTSSPAPTNCTFIQSTTVLGLGLSYYRIYADPNPIIRTTHNYAMQIDIKFTVGGDNTGFVNVWRDGIIIASCVGQIGFGFNTYWKNGLYRVSAPEEQIAQYQNFMIVAHPLVLGTGTTYTPTSGDQGDAITVAVVAQNAAGFSLPATSAATSTVIAAATGIALTLAASPGSFIETPSIITVTVLTGAVPVNTVLPTIVGVAQVGQPLTVNSPGSWTNPPILFYTYQWNTSAAAPSTVYSVSLTGSNASDQGFQFREVIPSSSLTASGTVVGSIRVGFSFATGTTSGTMVAYIGEAAATGNPSDFDGNQVHLTFGGAGTLTAINGATQIFSDYVPFTLDATKNLVISMFFGGTTVNTGSLVTGPITVYFSNVGGTTTTIGWNPTLTPTASAGLGVGVLNATGGVASGGATLSSSATITSLSVYIAVTANGDAILGIYDNTGSGGNPGNRLAFTASTVLVAGWNTIPVITPVLLSAGTYWLLIVTDNGGTLLGNMPGTSGHHWINGPFVYTMPPVAPVFPNVGTFAFAVYATFTTPASIDPSATIANGLQTQAGMAVAAGEVDFRAGSGASPILGATSATYYPDSNDLNNALNVSVVAHNAIGASLAATSTPTSAVIAAPTIPINTVIPTISGTAQVNQTLTVNFPGSWTNPPISFFTYQWNVVGSVTPTFSVSGGQIRDPNGNLWHGAGVGVLDQQIIGNIGVTNGAALANQIRTLMPNINLIRIANYILGVPSSYAAFVTTMTQNHVVCVFENHDTASSVYTGTQLQNESNWYAGMASYYKSNPYVWFQSINEPGTGDFLQMAATYNAIRGTGNNTIVCFEAGAGAQGVPSTLGSLTFTNSMTNVVWDLHCYDFESSYSTLVATITSDQNSRISAMQAVTSANGVMPVICLSTGNSTNGTTIDPGGTQEIQATFNNANLVGAAAWVWDNLYNSELPPNNLTNSGGASLDAYGSQVAGYIVTNPVVAIKAGPIQSATGISFTPLSGNLGENLSVSVVATNVAGPSAPAMSVATSAVIAPSSVNLTLAASTGVFVETGPANTMIHPTLQILTLSASTFTVGNPQGTVVGNVLNTNTGSTVTFASLSVANSLQLQNVGGVWQIQVGSNAPGATGTITFSLVETLVGANNTPRTTTGFSVNEVGSTITIGWTPATIPAGSGGLGVGVLNATGGVDSGGAILGSSATIVSISVYINTTASGDAILGIYDNTGGGGLPGNLIAATASTALVTGWNTLPVLTQVMLPAGTYWLLVVTDNGGTLLGNMPGTAGHHFIVSGFAYAMPTVAPTFTNVGTSVFAMYATLTTSGVLGIPVNTALPTISGTAQVGQQLTVNSPGVWTNPPTTYTYQWVNSATGDIPSATGIIYLAQPSDQSDTLRVRVVAHNSNPSPSAPALSAASATVAPPAASIATRVLNLISLLGVSTHIGQYNNSNTVADLAYLGVGKVRDGISGNLASVLPIYQSLINQGAQIIGLPWLPTDISFSGNVTGAMNVLNLGNTPQGTRALYAVEGPNEPSESTFTYNGFNSASTWQGVAQWQAGWHAAVRGTSGLNAVPVSTPTLVGHEHGNWGLQFLTVPTPTPCLSAAGTGFADIYNLHNYPQFGNTIQTVTPAGNSFTGQENFDFVNVGGFGGNPTLAFVQSQTRIITEFGYAFNVVTDEGIRGKDMVTALLNAWDEGFSALCIYTLYPDGSNPPDFNEIFNGPNAPRLSATYIHNFMTPLKDYTATANTFSPGPLTYTLNNLPSTGKSHLFQKSNGNYELIIWNNVENWNGGVITIPPTTVTVNFSVQISTINVYDQTIKATPNQTFTNTAAINIALSDYAIIVEAIGTTVVVTLNTLTLSANTFTVGDVQGTFIGNVLNTTTGSTVTFASLSVANSLQLANVGGVWKIQVGSNAPGTSGTITFSLVETLAGATNTPHTTTGFSVTENPVMATVTIGWNPGATPTASAGLGPGVINATGGVDTGGAILAETATINSISAYFSTAAGNVLLGFYDNTGAGGLPGALKAATAVTALVTGWNTLPVLSQVTVPAGTYWLLVAIDDNAAQLGNQPGTAGHHWAVGQPFAMPATAPTFPNVGTYALAMYATFNTAGVVLSNLSLSANTFSINDAQGTFIGNVQTTTTGSTVTFASLSVANSLQLQNVGGVWQIQVGSNAPGTAGTITFSLVETLPGATNTPHTTTGFSVTETGVPVIITPPVIT